MPVLTGRTVASGSMIILIRRRTNITNGILCCRWFGLSKRTDTDPTGGSTPGLHNKIPALKIFARGWVAQEPIFYTINAEIFQGLGPKRRESCHGDLVYENKQDEANGELLKGCKVCVCVCDQTECQ